MYPGPLPFFKIFFCFYYRPPYRNESFPESHLQPPQIYCVQWIMADKPIQIQPTDLLQRIPCQPLAEGGVVVAVAVGVEAGFGVAVFGREAQGPASRRLAVGAEV